MESYLQMLLCPVVSLGCNSLLYGIVDTDLTKLQLV